MRNRETVGSVFALLWLALVAAACGSPTPTPTPTPSPTATPTPEPVEEVTVTPDEASFSGSIVVNGRPYVREELPDGAVLHYEPWIQFITVQQVVDTYFRTKETLRKELTIEDPPLPEIYVLLPEQLHHFVAEGEFANPVFLAGLSSHIFREGEVSESKVYVNARGEELLRNVAHELTHPATPGVPTWLSEGVAEYIAARVQMETDPDQARFRVLDSRGRVRRALQRGELLDLQELQEFSWKEAEQLQQLELVYAESWQLVEYMVQATSTQALVHLMETHREDELGEGDIFLDSLGITSEALWVGFTKDLLENLTVEETEGVALCAVAHLGNEAGLISRDWNIFLNQIDQSQPELAMDEFIAFKERWQSLMRSSADLRPSEGLTTYYERMESYLENMVVVMDGFIENDIQMGNRLLLAANLQYSSIVEDLRDEFDERRWLACAPPHPA